MKINVNFEMNKTSKANKKTDRKVFHLSTNHDTAGGDFRDVVVIGFRMINFRVDTLWIFGFYLNFVSRITKNIFYAINCQSCFMKQKGIFLHYDSAKFCNSWHDVIIVYWSMIHLGVKTIIYHFFDKFIGMLNNVR